MVRIRKESRPGLFLSIGITVKCATLWFFPIFMKLSPSLETRLILHVDLYQLEKRLLRPELLDPPMFQLNSSNQKKLSP